MKVRIIFSGLCLFAPKISTSTVDVLLPRTPKDASRHRPVLLFDYAHTQPSQTPLGQYVHVGLDDQVVSLGDKSGASLTICDQVLNISPALGATIRSQVDDKLTSIVTLTSGSMSGVLADVCWRWRGGGPRSAAYAAEWTYDSSETSLDLRVVDWSNASSIFATRLQPVNDVVELRMLNLPADQLPPDPTDDAELNDNDPAHHFGTYFQLAAGQVNPTLPTYAKGVTGCGPNGCPPFKDEGPSSFSCMLAQVDAH